VLTDAVIISSLEMIERRKGCSESRYCCSIQRWDRMQQIRGTMHNTFKWKMGNHHL